MKKNQVIRKSDKFRGITIKKLIIVIAAVMIFLVYVLEHSATSKTDKEVVKELLNDNGSDFTSIEYIKRIEDGIVTFYQNEEEKVGYGFIASRKKYPDRMERPLEEINDDWQWINRGDLYWSDFSFNGGGQEAPYAYYGTITNPSINKVTLNGKTLDIVQISEGKRVWYYFGEEKWYVPIDEGLKAYAKDGTVIEAID